MYKNRGKHFNKTCRQLGETNSWVCEKLIVMCPSIKLFCIQCAFVYKISIDEKINENKYKETNAKEWQKSHTPMTLPLKMYRTKKFEKRSLSDIKMMSLIMWDYWIPYLLMPRKVIRNIIRVIYDSMEGNHCWLLIVIMYF